MKGSRIEAIRIDRSLPTPASAQVREALRDAVDRGRILPGEQVPTVRALAGELGLVPNTIARAYRELEAAGYLEGRGRAGTFVTQAPPQVEAPAAALREAAQRYVLRATHLGFDREEAMKAVRSVR